jgi:CO/xanthine dehydrogenase Mo-binding subunit
MMIGAADMGTGCDTTLAQIAADCLDCDVDDIVVYGVDTDISPYDSGSYASSTAYVTGNATIKACTELKKKICAIGARILEVEADAVDFDGKVVYVKGEEEKNVTLKDISTKNMCGCELTLEVSASHTSPKSPPPFMASMAEVEVDTETGEIKLVDFVSCVDCGTPINPALVKIQVEGGVAQGIGMALYEDVTYTDRGMIAENSFMQYKIPSRVDLPTFRTEIAKGSYEPTGPFGVKSVGEVVINTASPAIAHAVANATGVRVRELPITPEKILRGLHKIGE